MLKKTPESGQLNLVTSPKSLFSENSLKMYEGNCSWHNQFCNQVTIRIDENIFRPLYCQDKGTPNTSGRIPVAMMILKEAEELSDQKFFENCRFNMLVCSACITWTTHYRENQPITYFYRGLWAISIEDRLKELLQMEGNIV